MGLWVRRAAAGGGRPRLRWQGCHGSGGGSIDGCLRRGSSSIFIGVNACVLQIMMSSCRHFCCCCCCCGGGKGPRRSRTVSNGRTCQQLPAILLTTGSMGREVIRRRCASQLAQQRRLTIRCGVQLSRSISSSSSSISNNLSCEMMVVYQPRM